MHREVPDRLDDDGCSVGNLVATAGLQLGSLYKAFVFEPILQHPGLEHE